MEHNQNNQTDLREILKQKLSNSIKSAVDSGNYRVQVKDFGEIKQKREGNLVLFNHPVYNKVRKKKLF